MRSNFRKIIYVFIAPIWLFLSSLLFFSLQARSDVNSDFKYLVLGVISDSRPNHGVVLLKSASTSKTFAVRSREYIETNIQIESVAQDYVSFRIKDKIFRVKVGDYLDQNLPINSSYDSNDIAIREGIERQGNIVRVSSSLREYVAGPSLSKILMQAAAIPQYTDGELRGFGLFEIEKDSIYETAGFINGDVILAINGQHLNNVGQAIKILHSLKTENEVEVQLLRDGVERKLLFQIQ
jgi:type II secretory pathway component PulC